MGTVWRKKKNSRLIAWLMAGMMILSGIGAWPVSAQASELPASVGESPSDNDAQRMRQSGAQTETHTLDTTTIDATGKNDKDEFSVGTTFADGYFVIEGKVVQRIKTQKTQYIETGSAGNGSIKFEVTGTATAVFQVSSTGGTNESPVALKDGNGTDCTNKESITVVSGTNKTTITYENLTAGTYYLYSPEDSTRNRGVRIHTMEVTETIAIQTVTETHTLDTTTIDATGKNDKDEFSAGTTFADGYFAVEGKVVQRIKTQKTQYIETGSAGSGSIKFEVTGTATAVFQVSSTGGTNESPVALKDGNGTDCTNKESITVVSGTNKTTITYENLTAGTYYLYSPEDSARNRGVRIHTMEVTETSQSGVTRTPPTVASCTATLEADGKTVTVAFTGNAGSEGSNYVVEVCKDGGEWKEAGRANGVNADGTVLIDLSKDTFGTGNWSFRVYGIAGTNKTTIVTAATSIPYVKELGKPSIATLSLGNASMEVTWKQVAEADQYFAYLYDSENGAFIKKSDAIIPESASAELSYKFTGLSNGKKYWIAVEAVRTTPAASVMSDKKSGRPYTPVDTSNAIPGLTVCNQDGVSPVVLRDAGNITLSQAATSGGLDAAKTNLSIFYLNQLAEGDFSISAKVRITSRAYTSSKGGLYFGAADGLDETAKMALVGFRGGLDIRAFRDKPGSGTGTSELAKYTEGTQYSVSIARSGDTYNMEVSDGTNTYTKTFKNTDLYSTLYGEVYPVIVLCGVTADVSDVVIKVAGETKFESATLTGSVTPFEDNWAEADTPVITGVTVDNAAQTITVGVDCEVGVTGAGQVVVEMYDEAGNKVDSQSASAFGQTQHTLTFKPASSGLYSFVAIASRPGEDTVKTSAKVTATQRFISTLQGTVVTAFSKGNGSVKVNWDAVKEATGYNVYYKEQGTSAYTLAGENVQGTTYTITGLHIGTTYTILVKAVRAGEEAQVDSTVDKAVTDEVEREWYYSAFGQGVDAKIENNGFSGSVAENNLQLWELNSKGKIVPASTDGLAFYYTAIDPDTENFTLSADVTVDSWTYTNGQEGFGLMAADAVGTNGDSSVFWNNSYMNIVTKTEFYWDPTLQQVSDAGEKYTMRLGAGAQEKIGVTAENLADFQNGDVSAFSSKMTTLDTRAPRAGLPADNYNTVGNYSNSSNSWSNDIAPLQTTFHLTIQRNNTGYLLSYTNENGETTTQKYYHGDEGDNLTRIDKDNIYVGFFASRAVKISVKNVSLTTINPADDAPAELRPITYVTPNCTIESAKFSNSAGYEVVYYGNADGMLRITNGNSVVTDWVEVKANTKARFWTSLKLGSNTLKVTFVPDPNYCPSRYERLSSYDTQQFNYKVEYKKPAGNIIYVSPNGSPYAVGSKDQPMDIYTAVKYAKGGNVILLKEGTYSLNQTLVIERGIDGTAENNIYMIADPEATSRPVLDFNRACAGMIMAGDYWYFQGFDVTNSANAQKGIQVSGSYNTLDNLMAYRNGNTGIQISRYKGTDAWEDWPSHNLILNCTSYLNADAGYEDADGFAAKLTIADGNVFDGCIAAYNADDGWDLFAKVESGPIGQVEIRNCVAFKNGYVMDENGNEVNAGNGNGFKMGGSSISGYHTLRNSIAFANKAKGIDSNSCPDIQVYSSTSFDNESYNVAFYTNDAKNTDFLASGVLSYKKSNSEAENLKPKGQQDQSKIYGVLNYYFNGAESTNSVNEKAADSWFVSLDTNAAIHGGIGRNADGTICMNGYLALTDEVPASVGARMSGTPSRFITLPAYVSYEEDDEEDSTDAPVSQETKPEQPAAPAKQPAKKPVVAVPAGTETVKKLIVNQVTDWNNVDAALEELIREAGASKAVLEVELGKYQTLTKDIVAAIQGKDITLRLEQESGVIWEINGLDVEKPGEVSMLVKMNSTGIPEEPMKIFDGVGECVQFSLEHEGEFGFSATMKFPAGVKNNGKFANLFYYNNGTFEWMGSSKVEEGKAEFLFTHASDYVVVFTEAVLTAVPETQVENVADTTQNTEASATPTETVEDTDTESGTFPIVLIIIAIIVVAGIAIGVVVTRKKNEEQ